MQGVDYRGLFFNAPTSQIFNCIKVNLYLQICMLFLQVNSSIEDESCFVQNRYNNVCTPTNNNKNKTNSSVIEKIYNQKTNFRQQILYKLITVILFTSQITHSAMHVWRAWQ